MNIWFTEYSNGEIEVYDSQQKAYEKAIAYILDFPWAVFLNGEELKEQYLEELDTAYLTSNDEMVVGEYIHSRKLEVL